MPKKVGMVKRLGRMAKKQFKKRYVTKTGKGLRISQIMKDVNYLKSVLNPEKKRFQLQTTDAKFGQISGNNNAYWVTDVTPVPSQGVTSVTRTGNSIKVHSSHLRFQFQAMSSSNGSPIKIKVMLVKVIGEPQLISSAPTELLKPNPFILNAGSNAGIIDYNSDRREDTFRRFVVLRQKSVTLRANYHTGQHQLTDVSMGVKFKSHHVKFTTDGNQTVADGQLFILCLADNGNSSDATVSTLTGTPQTAINTGINLQYDISTWYYDN